MMVEAVPVRVLLPSGQVAYEASLLPGTSVEELLMKIRQAGDFGPWLSLVLGSQKLSSATTLGSLKLNAQDVFYLIQQPFEPKVKVLLLGGSMAGKTALQSTFSSGQFVGNYEYPASIGVDFQTAILTEGGNRARMQVWDTPGNERLHSITMCFLRGRATTRKTVILGVKHQGWGWCSHCMNFYTLKRLSII